MFYKTPKFFVLIVVILITISLLNNTHSTKLYAEKQNANTQGIPMNYVGVWSGQGTQINPTNSWSVLLTLTEGNIGTIVGSIAYPSLRCGGTLRLLGVNNNSIELLEDITYGTNCIDEGTIVFELQSVNEIIFDWYKSGISTRAEGSVSRLNSGGGTGLPNIFKGTWQGETNQGGNWTILFSLTSSVLGEIAGSLSYPSLRCGGELTLTEVSNNIAVFSQDITFGSCVDNLMVSLEFMSDGVLLYKEYYPNGSVTGSGEVSKINDLTIDPLFYRQWGLTEINIMEAWDISQGNPNVVIAVIDSGVDYNHVDLYGDKIITNNDYDYVNDDDDAVDDNGHGTHVAGIAASYTNNSIGIAGVCPQCSILPLKVLDDNGKGDFSNVASAIIYATDHGADVINMSLGANSCTQELAEAINYAYDNNVTLVAASGNACPIELAFGVASFEVSYPAAFQRVIAVGATTPDRVRADFSHYGSSLDISAPGTHILSTHLNGNYKSLDGTSMASPMVAGVVGLILSQYPSLTPAQTQDILQRSAFDVATSGWDEQTGWGIVDAAQALATTPDDSIGIAPEDSCQNLQTVTVTQAMNQVEIYRDFRDEVLANSTIGHSYISAYYDNAPELVNVLLANPSLMSRTYSFLSNAADEFESLLPSSNVQLALSQDLYDEAEALVYDFVNASDGETSAKMLDLWDELALQNYIGVDTKVIWEDMNQANKVFLPVVTSSE
ncbi:MAG TPA: S8 family peptidase [Chloroflexota bacterium]|nr:S8 family peptidase [Chloroflexota bacterium]